MPARNPSKCERCGHAHAKHLHRANGQCAVRVYRTVRRPGGGKVGKLIVCDCPGFLAYQTAEMMLAARPAGRQGEING